MLQVSWCQEVDNYSLLGLVAEGSPEGTLPVICMAEQKLSQVSWLDIPKERE